MKTKNNYKKSGTRTLAESVLNSALYKRLTGKAAAYIAQPALALTVLHKAADKHLNLKDGRVLQKLRQDAEVLTRLVLAVVRRQYKHLPYQSLLKALAAILYLLFLDDLIPDFIPGLGLMDDAAVVGWVVNSIRRDIDRFQAWEEGRASMAV